MILDPGFNLTLRPMKYPAFYEQYRNAIKNTWTVEEVDLFSDIADLNQRLTPAERHLINRLVAFFATGDSIVSNNLVLNLYKHINFAYEVINTVRAESPELFDTEFEKQIVAMLEEAVDCETAFAEDLLGQGVAGLSLADMRAYLESVADQRLQSFGIKKRYGTRNPFSFMELQDVQELTNFFERRVSAYQIAVSGAVALHEEF